MYRELLLGLHARACASPVSGAQPLPVFALYRPIVLIASPGRDRLMMGHVSRPSHTALRAFLAPSPSVADALDRGCPLVVQTDFGGLGGFTIDCATREELLCVAQLTDDGAVHLHNGDAATFPARSIPLSSLRTVASDASAYGQCNWPTTDWSSYVCAALTYMLCPRFPAHSDIAAALSSSHGIRYFVSSPGALCLPHTGGVSSSAALTGAVSMALSHLLFPSAPLSRSALAAVDYGEYFLGKFAGCADKMAQLFAQSSTVTVIGSKPERFLSSLRFPAALSLLIAENDMPRLTLPAGREWLRAQGLDEGRAEEALTWAKSVMVRFGSTVYSRAAEILVQTVEERGADVGLTGEEAHAVRMAMLGHRKTGEKPEEGRGGPLLRELCSGGLLEHWLPHLAGWEQRRARYALVFKALQLLPVKLAHVHQGGEFDLHPRKAALYGLSEVERGTAYLRELERINERSRAACAADAELEAAIERVLHFVELSHDGDRAVIDFRRPAIPSHPRPDHVSRHDVPFLPAPWAEHPTTSLSSATLQSYASLPAELVDTVGSYERSVANVDEECDAIREAWRGKAAARISAAGMGGRLSIHCRREALDDVRAWLEKRGWRCRQPRPGAPTQHVAFID